VLHRTLTAVPRAGRQLADIIGTGAALRLGNRGGDLWTDLTAPVAPPAPEVRGGAGAVEYEDPVRGAMLARAVSVAGTPWLLVVELPRAAALAGTERFLVRAMVAGALFVLAGAGAGWLLSRRLTVPRIGRDRTDEVLALNRELEAFSYSVSHDLRAPLRAIDGFSRILSEDHAAGLGPEAARLLGVIRTNARHMGHLIDDLLAFSRLGRKELVTTDVDMAALARAAADELRAGAPERAVEVELGALPAARGDWALLRQVWVNLLSNAFKYSRGRVPARITVAAEVRNGETVYLVSDNGVGFDMAYGDKLFGVFQRLHRADQFEGTGVGLAIVQRIVHRHGGRVWAEAAPDAGATFSFTLEAREGA
jgi:signal transduction histidine kinase